MTETSIKELTTDDSNLRKFNHNTTLLIFQLMKIYPDDQDLQVYKDKFEWSQRINARLACEKFITEAAPFINEIMTENEEFFLNMDYNNYTDNKGYIQLLHKVADLWKSSHNKKLKKNIWRYFKILIIYGIKITRRRDLAEIVNVYRKKKNQPLLTV